MTAAGDLDPEVTRLVTAQRIVTQQGDDVTALVIRGGTVSEAGDVDVLRARFPAAEPVDLGDAVVVPGFNDAHCHPGMAAVNLLGVDVSPERVASRSELLTALRREVARTPPGRWIRASRYDHTRTTGGSVITRAELDEISTSHPMVLVNIGAHWGVVNTAGLEAGGHRDADGVEAADLPRDGAGRLTGRIDEQALFDYCYPSMAGNGATVVPEPDLQDWLRALTAYAAQVHAAGIVSVTDALSGPSELQMFAEAERRGELTLRVNALLAHPHLDRWIALGLRTGFGSDTLRIGGIKAFADGAVAGRTCLVEEPFEGSEDHGLQTTSDEAMVDLAMRCQRSGNRLAVHANGDRAISKVLAAIDAAQQQFPDPTLRHRIEHCSIVTSEILATMRRLGVIAVPFGSYVAYHGQKLLAWYGRDRLNRMFTHRAFLDAGIPVAGSSDYPCGPYEPLLGIQSCVTRESVSGEVLGADQRVSVREALRIYTVGSAFASGEHRTKGRLAPGLLADFTVLDEDLLRVAPNRIASIAVRSTWRAGQCVWQA